MNSKKRLTLKQRKLVNTAIIVIMLLVIVGVNILTSVLVNRFPSLEADVTSKGAYSLNATTKEYLNYMEDEIKVSVLSSEEEFVNNTDDLGSSSYYYQVNKLLEEMGTYENLTLEYKDISASSATKLQEEYPDVDWSTTDNLILVEYGDKYEVLTTSEIFSFSEEYAMYYSQNVISAQYIEECVLSTIQKLTAENILKVGLSVGNGEYLNEETAQFSSYSYVSMLLDDNAYDVDNINLLTEEIPEDMDAIIMLAPSVDITDEQSEKINTWLINGGNYGKTFFYVPNDYIQATDNIDLLLEQWGMKVTNGYVYENDLKMALSGSNTPQLTSIVNYANEAYTAELKSTALPVIMPYSLGVEITDSEAAVPLLTSTDTAQILLLDESTEELVFASEEGSMLNYAAVGTKGNSDNSKKSSFVVWGSYDGLSNSALTSTNFNNSAYFVNIFNTSLGNEMESIVVESVSLGIETIAVSSAQQIAILVIFVFIIPIAIFVIGIIVWLRRKNK